jgi:hypothetical protein
MKMNKLLKISYLALAFLFFLNLDASAQIKPTKKKTDTPTEQPSEPEDSKPSSTTKKKTTKKTDQFFDESGGFKHRLWYGGNFNLGLNSGQGASIFAIGITPMVGYKIIGGLSAGPRVGITYTNLKTLNSQNKISSVGLTDYSAGLFTRYKVFDFFAHAEYEYLSQQFPGGDNYGRILLDSEGKALKSRFNQQNRYLGIGYNSGNGLFGYEVMGLYNFSLANSTTTVESPFSLRFGFTYKF